MKLPKELRRYNNLLQKVIDIIKPKSFMKLSELKDAIKVEFKGVTDTEIGSILNEWVRLEKIRIENGIIRNLTNPPQSVDYGYGYGYGYRRSSVTSGVCPLCGGKTNEKVGRHARGKTSHTQEECRLNKIKSVMDCLWKFSSFPSTRFSYFP